MTAGEVLGWLVAFFYIVAYAKAIGRWSATPAQPSDSIILRHARIWAGVAVLLVLGMAWLLLRSGGAPGATPDYLPGLMLWWLLQAAGSYFALRAGACEARTLGREPMGGATPGLILRPRTWGILGLLLIGMVGWTALLGRFAGATPGSGGPFEALGLEGDGEAWLHWAVALGMLTLAPLLEEALFRHYLLHAVARAWPGAHGRAAAAIVLTTLVWSALHWGMLEPAGIKWMQTLLLGGILGATAWRYGILAALALHLGHNLLLIPIFLIQS